MSTLGERVKKERIKLGMTQDELAKKAGYSSRTSINKIENGRPASLKVVHKLAGALNVSEWYLLGSQEEGKDVYIPQEVKDQMDKDEENILESTNDDVFLKEFINYLRGNNWETTQITKKDSKGRTITKYLVSNKNGVSIALTKDELKKLEGCVSNYVEDTLLSKFKSKLGI